MGGEAALGGKEPTGPTPLGLVWLKGSASPTPIGLRRALQTEARVYTGALPPDADEPSSIVYCADDDDNDVATGVQRLRALSPNAAIVVFGLSLDTELVRTAMRAGARGFVHAGMPPEQIARAVSVAAGGEVALPRELLRAILIEQRGPDLSLLKPRHREILELVAEEGLTNAEIARRLYLSESSVKQHLRAAYKLLGVKSRNQAVGAIRRNSAQRIAQGHGRSTSRA